jgi:hypothetical protein
MRFFLKFDKFSVKKAKDAETEEKMQRNIPYTMIVIKTPFAFH